MASLSPKLPVLNLPKTILGLQGRKLRYFSSSCFDVTPSALSCGVQGPERPQVLPMCVLVQLAPRGNDPCPRMELGSGA